MRLRTAALCSLLSLSLLSAPGCGGSENGEGGEEDLLTACESYNQTLIDHVVECTPKNRQQAELHARGECDPVRNGDLTPEERRARREKFDTCEPFYSQSCEEIDRQQAPAPCR